MPAAAGELGHLEFLQVLCHDQTARRDAAAIGRCTRRARFEQTLILEGFDFTANPKLPAAATRDLAALRWVQPGQSVILYGPVSQRRAEHAALTRLLATVRDNPRRAVQGAGCSTSSGTQVGLAGAGAADPILDRSARCVGSTPGVVGRPLRAYFRAVLDLAVTHPGTDPGTGTLGGEIRDGPRPGPARRGGRRRPRPGGHGARARAARGDLHRPVVVVVVVVVVRGEVDLHTEPLLFDAVTDEVARVPAGTGQVARVVLDVTAMTFCGVRGLSVLVHGELLAQDAGAVWAVAGLVPRLARHLIALWPAPHPVLYPDRCAAVAAVGLGVPWPVSGAPTRPDPLQPGTAPRGVA